MKLTVNDSLWIKIANIQQNATQLHFIDLRQYYSYFTKNEVLINLNIYWKLFCKSQQVPYTTFQSGLRQQL